MKKVKKPKKSGSKERLASPRPSKPRTSLRWSPTGRIFDLKLKLIESSDSECQSDCSKGDNACTSNPQEPTSKQFPNSTSFLGRLSKFVYGTVRFGNDHVAAILGYGDLQWGNILIVRVYYVEGLGHNLFSVGQFCDSDIELCIDDHIGGQPLAAPRTTPAALAPQVLQTPIASTTTTDTTPTPTNSSSQTTDILNTSQDVDKLHQQQQHDQ
ncbi:hypothetical protein Tco_1225929 [Tanacetum coccineum]